MPAAPAQHLDPGDKDMMNQLYQLQLYVQPGTPLNGHLRKAMEPYRMELERGTITRADYDKMFGHEMLHALNVHLFKGKLPTSASVRDLAHQEMLHSAETMLSDPEKARELAKQGFDNADKVVQHLRDSAKVAQKLARFRQIDEQAERQKKLAAHDPSQRPASDEEITAAKKTAEEAASKYEGPMEIRAKWLEQYEKQAAGQAPQPTPAPPPQSLPVPTSPQQAATLAPAPAPASSPPPFVKTPSTLSEAMKKSQALEPAPAPNETAPISLMSGPISGDRESSVTGNPANSMLKILEILSTGPVRSKERRAPEKVRRDFPSDKQQE